MSRFSAVKIVEIDGLVSIEIDGVPLTTCTGFKIERAVEPRLTKITFSILSRDLSLTLDRSTAHFIDVTTLGDEIRRQELPPA